MNQYIGHESQYYGVEEHRLVGGKGDGMRLLLVNNGAGIEATVSLDRNGDLSRLRFKGINMGFFSAVGYTAPTYYDDKNAGWCKTFTAGFLTTCGLQAVGTPNVDQGEELPLHGSIGNTPTDHSYWYEEDGKLIIKTRTSDEYIFGRKLQLNRTYVFPIGENWFTYSDTIVNTGDREEPLEVLYHMNMGYPLLDEDSVIDIPSVDVRPRNQHAAEDIANWKKMLKPIPGYEEVCYYHTMPNGQGHASIFQPKLGIGLAMDYDANELDQFTEWKMMGVRDYVLGLEPGNCTPDGRNVCREKGILKFLQPGESKTYTVKISMMEK